MTSGFAGTLTPLLSSAVGNNPRDVGEKSKTPIGSKRPIFWCFSAALTLDNPSNVVVIQFKNSPYYCICQSGGLQGGAVGDLMAAFLVVPVSLRGLSTPPT